MESEREVAYSRVRPYSRGAFAVKCGCLIPLSPTDIEHDLHIGQIKLGIERLARGGKEYQFPVRQRPLRRVFRRGRRQ